jgi:hypothetical protein
VPRFIAPAIAFRGRQVDASEELEREHRLLSRALDGEKGAEGGDADDDRDRDGGAPAAVAGLDDREDDRRQGQRAECDAGGVEAPALRIGALAHHDQRGSERSDDDRHVDEEDRSPADALDQCAAEQRMNCPQPRRAPIVPPASIRLASAIA